MGQDQCSIAKFLDGYPIPYSKMYIGEEEGDFAGWDLRATEVSDDSRIPIVCGEGEVEGPKRGTSRLNDGVAVVCPNAKSCGDSVEPRFEARGARIWVGEGVFEFVPQHKNFIKEERWR
jgi:hypothetical protein